MTGRFSVPKFHQLIIFVSSLKASNLSRQTQFFCCSYSAKAALLGLCFLFPEDLIESDVAFPLFPPLFSPLPNGWRLLWGRRRRRTLAPKGKGGNKAKEGAASSHSVTERKKRLFFLSSPHVPPLSPPESPGKDRVTISSCAVIYQIRAHIPCRARSGRGIGLALCQCAFS